VIELSFTVPPSRDGHDEISIPAQKKPKHRPKCTPDNDAYPACAPELRRSKPRIIRSIETAGADPDRRAIRNVVGLCRVQG
jgi:hypothetical protein